MSKNTKQLLVEGLADEAFFSACCDNAGVGEVDIGPPTSFNGQGMGKGNAIKILPDLIDEMVQERVTHLGMIVDADYSKTGGLGFAATWEKIAKILEEKSYDTKKTKIASTGGYIFKSNDGLPDVGIWIMPNNKDGGFLEDFIKKSLASSEKKLFKHAQDTVNALEDKRFRELHVSKTEVMTWLAWQKIPGQSFASLISGKLLDLKSGMGKEFIDWLKKVYK